MVGVAEPSLDERRRCRTTPSPRRSSTRSPRADAEPDSLRQASVWFDPAARRRRAPPCRTGWRTPATPTTLEDQLGTFNTVIDAIVLVLNAFAVIALIAASFGIVNTLLMSVQERTREIGLMKAMGMASGRVFGLFSIEAVVIGFLGSAMGARSASSSAAVSSALSGALLSNLPGLTLIAFDPVSIAAIILVVMAVAFLAGTLPAARAAARTRSSRCATSERPTPGRAGSRWSRLASARQNGRMDPVAALEEIAFLLERDRASSFKSKAFRRAADVIGAYSADDLAARVRDGRLKRTKGIGDTTYTVIAEAVGGAVPTYLADLREKSGPAVASSQAGLRAQLKGDLHSHTEWSDGTTPIVTMARAAQLVGLEYLVISDHSPNLTVANGLSAERLDEQLDVLDELNAVNELGAGGIRLLSGIETDILLDGALDQRPDMLDRLDVVVASVHSKLRMESREMTERMLRAIENPRMNVLGHCTGRLVEGSRGTRPQSTFDARAVFDACAEHDVAVEINSRPERQDPPDDLIQVALDAGCRFSIDTDAHAPGHFSFLDLGAARAEANGVPADRIVTTWPVDRLLEWAGSKR